MAVKAIQKWGNSLGLRIPKDVAERAHLREGSIVDVSAEDDRVVVTPARRRYSLRDLLAGVRKDNLHGEVDTGEPVGKEVL